MSEPSKITIDGVTVEAITLTTSDRGYRYEDFRDSMDGSCFLGESSGTGPATIWLGLGDNLMLLSRAHVAALLPHLQRFVERGDLGGEDAVELSPPCDNCGHQFHQSGGRWWCYWCGNAMPVSDVPAVPPADLAVIDDDVE